MKGTALYSPEPAQGWLPWAALSPLLGVAMVALPTIALWKLEKSLHLLDAQGGPAGFPGLVFLLFVEFALTGVLVLAWVRYIERRPLATIGLAAAGRSRTFLRGLGVGLATSALLVAAIWGAGGYQASGLFAAFGSPVALAQIAVLFAGFAVQSSVEEILFRGWLLSVVARRWNVAGAVVVNALLFALLHFSPRQHWSVLLGTLLFALFACGWALVAGNIWGVMGWHAAWNWLIAVGFELPITGIETKVPALLAKLTPTGSELLTGGSQGPEGSVLCTLFFAGACAFLFRVFLRRREA